VLQFLAILLTIAFLLFGVMTFFNLSDPVGLGVKKKKLAELSFTPNAVSSQTDDQDRYVAPLPFKGDLLESKESIKNAVAGFRGFFLQEESDHYLYYVAVSPLMRYRDDVEFFFDAEEDVIHFRSASRVGYSDMGANRKRYEKILQSYAP
jgi:uncharacterized protein (DUF1499 family)